MVVSNEFKRAALKQKQSLDLESKILLTQRRIKEWRDYFAGDVFISFSGGKDSTVLKHIVDNDHGNIPSVFVNTGLEYPEIQSFVRDIKSGKYPCYSSNVEILRPKMRFDEVIKTYGYPVVSKEISKNVYYARKAIAEGRQENYVSYKKLKGTFTSPDGTKSRFNCEKWCFLLDAPFKIAPHCCDKLKKSPVKEYVKKHKRYPITASMACESELRTTAWLKNGCNGFNMKFPISNPMSFWTEQDVLQYIVEYKLPYCKIYGEIKQDKKGKFYTTGLDRTGCMFCAFGVHLEKNPNRFQQMKKTHPNQYEYCMNKLGLKGVLDFLNVKYE